MTVPESSSPKRRVLVVDDEPFVVEAVKMMLTHDGHSVETAKSGREALSLFNRGGFDLVITDYAMPEMKGDELAARIKALAADVPIIMITAYSELLESLGTPLPHVGAVISKPFMMEDLRNAIAKAAAG
jgi:CheY-like chemotaxis protein